MLIVVISGILLLYLLTALNAGPRLSLRNTRFIRTSLFVLIPFLIGVYLLESYGYYARGYWFPRVLFWIVFFLVMSIYGLGATSILSKLEKFFYTLLFYLPLLSLLTLLIPLLAAVIALIVYPKFIGNQNFIMYADDKIRIERDGMRFLSPDPPLVVYKKDGLFSYRDSTLPIRYNIDRDRLFVNKISETEYFITHYAPENWEVGDSMQEVRYSIKR